MKGITKRPSVLGDPFLALLAGRKIVQYREGQNIFSQGDPCSEVYYIQEGGVKLTVVSNTGKSAVIAILAKGEFFGEECITGQPAHVLSAITLAPSTIAVLKRKSMARLLTDEPAVCSRFISHLLARNIRIKEDLMDHLFHSSEKRLARALLLLSHYGNERKVVAKVNQDMLAEMVGTTRSRVNYFMNKFRRLGFIDYNGELSVNEKSLKDMLHDSNPR